MYLFSVALSDENKTSTVCKIKGIRISSQETQKVANFDLIRDLVQKLQDNQPCKIKIPQFNFRTDATNKEIKNYAFHKFLKNTANQKRFLIHSISKFMTLPFGIVHPKECNNLHILHEAALENGLSVSDQN